MCPIFVQVLSLVILVIFCETLNLRKPVWNALACTAFDGMKCCFVNTIVTKIFSLCYPNHVWSQVVMGSITAVWLILVPIVAEIALNISVTKLSFCPDISYYRNQANHVNKPKICWKRKDTKQMPNFLPVQVQVTCAVIAGHSAWRWEHWTWREWGKAGGAPRSSGSQLCGVACRPRSSWEVP